MPSKPSLIATVIALLVAVAVISAIGVGRLDGAGAASAPVPATGIQRLGSMYGAASGYDRYAMLITGRADAASAASQPGLSLVYHSGVSVNTVWDAGVPYSVAAANGWLLKDASGTYLKNTSFPDNFIGDVGNTAYANEWARRVGDYLASVGADGAYLDDVVADIMALSGTYPAKYPNQAAWENAMVSFIQIIGTSLKNRGFYVLLNAHKWIAGNGASDTGALEAEFWQRLGPYVSGLHNEYFIQNPINNSQLRGDGSAWYDNWAGWTNLITVTQNMGRDFWGLTYGSPTNTQAMRYVRASFLLFWDGSGGGVLYHEDGDPWSGEWTADVGTPSGGRAAVGVGWRREYSGGTVLVNPSTSSSQTFTLGGTYLMPDGSAVTSSTLGPKSGLVLRSTGATVPVNTALPTVTGTPQQAVLLSSTTGTWSGSPTSFARQWQRCDTAGSGCAAITGATGAQYALTATDVGKRVRVSVTATNASGSATANSAPTATVVASPPANTALPSISGSTLQGQTLTASPGTWTNSPSLAYQWQRCDSGGNACAAVAGATGTTFLLGATDVGSRHRVVVTATNGGGTATASSAASAVVTAPAPAVQPPANTALPSISGTTLQGQTLTASPGTWTNSPSLAYQWQRCDSGGNACAAVAGATGTTFLLGATDVGSRHRVVVTATNGGGTATASSAASAVVTAPAPAVQPPANTALPSISGTTLQGQTLTASTGTWSNSPTSLAYQWQRCDSGGGSCGSIAGATGSSVALTAADVGSRHRVVVTAANTAGSASATSAASAVVAAPAPTPQPPANTALPSVSGTAQEGKTLSASNGSWSSAPTSYGYRWRRCDSAGGACVDVGGATSSSYTAVAGDVGRTLRVVVTATNAVGVASATSAPSGVVAPLPVAPPAAPVSTTPPAVSGTAQETKALTASNGTWSNTPTSYAYQWRRCDTAGGACVDVTGATSVSHTLGSGDLGRTMRVVVRATNGGGTTAATSSQTGVVVAAPAAPAALKAPVNTAEPVLRGNDRPGKVLRATNGSWANAPTAFAYQWRRCDTNGTSCVAIPGADDTDYSVTSADAGRTLRAVVTASNAGGSASAASDPSDVIPTARGEETVAPTALAVPQLSGEARAGKTLVGSTGTWSRASSYDFQWRRCDAGGGACAPVGGATSPSYALDSDDVGHTLRVVVTASYGGGSGSAASSPSSVVAAMPVAVPSPANTALPEVDGETRAGRTLRASTGGWSNLPLGYTYQWRRCNATGGECSAVAGATGSRYDLTGDDIGRTLRVAVTAGNVGGSTTVTSDATAVVTAKSRSDGAPTPPQTPAPAAPTPPATQAPTPSPPAPAAPPSDPPVTNTGLPNVTGPELVGRFIQATLGAWSSNPKVVSVQWLRCLRDEVESCTPILGATQIVYTVTPDDVDYYVILKVTVSGPWGSTTVTSKFGRPVKR